MPLQLVLANSRGVHTLDELVGNQVSQTGHVLSLQNAACNKKGPEAIAPGPMPNAQRLTPDAY